MTKPISGSDPLRGALPDEVDLLELLNSVSRTWKPLFLGALLVTVAYIGWLSIEILISNPSNKVYKAIKLTFVGVDQRTYPNGAAFHLEDIIAPVIIQEVFEKHSLETRGITVEEFRRSLSIEPYAPTYALIVDRYRRLLSNTSLVGPEFESIERRMSAELASATSGAAMLAISLDRFELSSELVSKILSDLPATWAQYSITNKGVLDLDIELASAKSIDRELVNNIDYMVISDLLQEKTQLVEANIELLSEFDGAATLTDPITGVRLADLKQSLKDLQRYVIDDLMSPIRSLGLTRNRDLSLYYYEDKRQRLTEDFQFLQRQADLVKEAFEKYSSETSLATIAPVQDGVAYLGGGAQLSAGALDRVLDMSSEDKAEEYRQMLNQRWLDTNIKAADLQNQIAGVNRLITALKGEGQSETSKALKDEYLTRAERILPKILDRISDFLDITQRIYKQLSKESIGINGKLYEPITNQPYIKTFPIDIVRAVVVWAALLIIMAIIVVPSVMVRHAFKNRRKIVQSR